MKKSFLSILIIILFTQFSFAQSSKDEVTVLQISKDKWQWIADKDVAKLEPLFNEKAKFVHMGGTWKKAEELDIIKSGSIWYKKATVHDTAIEMFGKTAIVWNRITLEAVVRESEVKTEFTVTEVYQKKGKEWKLLALTFSSVRDTHHIKK